MLINVERARDPFENCPDDWVVFYNVTWRPRTWRHHSIKLWRHNQCLNKTMTSDVSRRCMTSRDITEKLELGKEEKCHISLLYDTTVSPETELNGSKYVNFARLFNFSHGKKYLCDFCSDTKMPNFSIFENRTFKTIVTAFPRRMKTRYFRPC